jgi:hypothetical protein
MDAKSPALRIEELLSGVTPRNPKLHRRVYTPKAGHEWNPLRKYRNVLCPCSRGRQGVKAKHCHGSFDLVTHEDARKIRKYLRELSAAGVIRASASDIAEEGGP